MKEKISISIEEELVEKINKEVETGLFRNKSHIIEYAVNKLLMDKKDG